MRCAHTDASRRATSRGRAQGESIVYDGKVIPFVPLAQDAAAAARRRAPARACRPWSSSGGSRLGGGRRRSLLGTANVVLRPLPDLAPAEPIVAGASLDAEGNPQLVLDPDGLVARSACGAAGACIEDASARARRSWSSTTR